MQNNELDIFASSSTTGGAYGISSDGSSFSIRLDNPLKLKGKRCNVSVKESTIWYNTPNITNGTNSKIYFNWSSTDYVVNVATGLYDFTNLKNSIAVALGNLGVATDLFVLVSDTATQKTGFTFSDTVVIDFTQSDTMRGILGWDSGTVNGSSGQTLYADNVAAFNVLNNYQIHSDIVSDGLAINGKYSSVIAIVNIPKGTNVGSQIVAAPFNPTKVDSENLIYSTKSTIKFWLTDQDGTNIQTLGETWSVLVGIEWM
jgi:hypothetical protein